MPLKRLLLLLALLPATLSAQQDSVQARADLTLRLPPGTFEIQGDTTFFRNDLTLNINLDGLTQEERVELAEAALQQDIVAAQNQGVPNWVYGGALVVAAGFVLAYSFKKETTTIINVSQEQNQEQDQTTETTETTIIRFPWCWPPGHCKKGGGGDE